MSDTRFRKWLGLLGAALTFGGMAVVWFALGYVEAAFSGTGTESPVGAIVIVFVGAAMFAVGSMMLLVAVVRPLFGRRRLDDLAERTRES